MSEHEIFFKIPAKTLLHKDVTFDIFSDSNKLGRLKISKGSIEWVPQNHKYGYHLTWEKFSAIMKNKGRK
ncbi:MAG: hypothetical protein IH886_07510 [Nitrospinae bacterium]|nr:hypothetical protein [Nitrospinota bacterium]